MTADGEKRGAISVVYFIFSPDDPRSLVKIGYTRGSIESRLKAMQTGHPFRLCLIMALEGGRDVELQLHRQFHNSRCHGEWFYPTDDVRGFIRDALGTDLNAAVDQHLANTAKTKWLASVLGWTDQEVRDGLAKIAV